MGVNSLSSYEIEVSDIADAAPQISLTDAPGPARSRPLANRLSCPIFLLAPNGRLQGLNKHARGLLGSGGDATTMWPGMVHPDDRESGIEMHNLCMLDGATRQGEYRVRTGEGSERWFKVVFDPDYRDEGASCNCLLTCIDVHDDWLSQQALLESLYAKDNMLDVSVDCIKMLNPDGALTHMNKAGCIALGVDPCSGFAMKWLGLLPPEVRKRGARALAVARTGRNARFGGKSILPGERPQYWDNMLTPILDASGATKSILCVSRNVTGHRVTEERLRSAGQHDDLTGLANRRTLRIYLSRTLSKAKERGSNIGLMLLDLDHFKHVNDSLGHPAGDHLLKTLGRRLAARFTGHSCVARLGGDEFAIVVPNLVDVSQLMDLARDVLLQESLPITFSGKVINGGVSIGCAIFPLHAADDTSLMRCADTALRDIKQDGRGGVRFFADHMLVATDEEQAQVKRAQQLIASGEIRAYYQPKVRLRDGIIVGFEALARTDDDTLEHTLPVTIAAAFRSYDLSASIGAVVQEAVFADIRRWIDCGANVLPVSLNASPVEFARDDYAERFLARLFKYRVPGELVEVEITEQSLAKRGVDKVVRAIHTLQRAGVRVALDDFGTGYSSLAHLRDYTIDTVKVDRSFVRNIEHDRSQWAIVRAIGELGANLGMTVIAEGVENHGQWRALLAAGYEVGQGYLFSRAVCSSQVPSLLHGETLLAAFEDDTGNETCKATGEVLCGSMLGKRVFDR